jgi:hypothetical protein
MRLTIVYITDDQIVMSEEWDGSLVEANEHAERRLASGAANRAEILDLNGTRRSVRPRPSVAHHII